MFQIWNSPSYLEILILKWGKSFFKIGKRYQEIRPFKKEFVSKWKHWKIKQNDKYKYKSLIYLWKLKKNKDHATALKSNCRVLSIVQNLNILLCLNIYITLGMASLVIAFLWLCTDECLIFFVHYFKL